ncbi:MAG: hypothetical protein KAY65_11375, partial [Planctomycetes bacterium]|nr:hypothetical protein [Planctomycetota bacterium]
PFKPVPSQQATESLVCLNTYRVKRGAKYGRFALHGDWCCVRGLRGVAVPATAEQEQIRRRCNVEVEETRK